MDTSKGLENIDGVVWFDGQYVDWKDAKVHVLTHTLHYGLGVFEGVRAYSTTQGPTIFRLRDHTDRLFESADTVKLKIPYSKDEINKAQIEVVKRNKLEEAYIRPMCFYGSEGLGLRADNLKVHCIVAAWYWPSYLSPELYEKGIKVKLSSYTRQRGNKVSRSKVNGNYVNSIVALNEALEAGFDEALMLDTEGNVAEGSGENFFMVKDGKIFTPDVEASLNGITRKSIIDLAKNEKIDVIEKNISPEEVIQADELFFTGTAAEVLPITFVDKNKISNGQRGPITEILQSKYSNHVRGKHILFPEWLTNISDN